jgi:hypothetical protein
MVMAILALASLVLSVTTYLQTRERVGQVTAALQERRVSAERALRMSQSTPDQLKARERELKAGRMLSSALTVPWDDFFREFETNTQADVTLLALVPDPSTGMVEVTAESRNLSAMVDYYEQFAASSRFTHAFVNEHEVITADPQKPVRFVMSGRWILNPPLNGAKE